MVFEIRIRQDAWTDSRSRPSPIAEFYLTLRTAIPVGVDHGGLNTEPEEDPKYTITIDNTWYHVTSFVAGGVPVFAIASPNTPSVMSKVCNFVDGP